MNVKHAWLTIEAEGYEGETLGPQVLLAAEGVPALVRQANARLVALGAMPLFHEVHYSHRPGEIALGGGIVARLFACDSRGINHYDPPEPRGE